MKRPQLTIADPQDQITSKLHLLKRKHRINVSRFCRDIVDEGINQYLEESAKKELAHLSS